jgi:oxygen-dependent protoporphyrinogen oxidase
MEVKTTAGDFRADRVYSTLPAPALAKLLPDYAPTLPISSVITLGLGYYNSVLKKQGFGYLVPSKENENILGAVWDSSVFPSQDTNHRRTRITAMVGGAHRPDLLNLTDDQIAEIAIADLEKHTGLTRRPDVISVHRSISAIPQFPVGYPQTLEKLRAKLAKKMPALHLLGNNFHGLSINDCIASATQAAMAN